MCFGVFNPKLNTSGNVKWLISVGIQVNGAEVLRF